MNIEDINEAVEVTSDEAKQVRGGWFGLAAGWGWTWRPPKPKPTYGGGSQMDEEEMMM